MMPELDGPGLIRRIRSSQRPGYVYAILLTAKSQKEDLVEGMEAGADDFLTKPFDRDELRVRLRAGERIIRLEQNLRETKVALIQTEKLAGLGRLAAGVAHEINNPLSFVVNNLALLRRDVLDALRVLDKYREGGDILARAEPGLAAEATRLEEEVDLPYFRENLPRLVRELGRGAATSPRHRAEPARFRPAGRGGIPRRWTSTPPSDPPWKSSATSSTRRRSAWRPASRTSLRWPATPARSTRPS